MKIIIIGTTCYREKMEEYRAKMETFGHEVQIPAFDDTNMNELELCQFNRGLIEWSDEAHIFWDQRSSGTIFDFGMCFALRKPIKIIYMETKTFKGVMEMYSEFRDRLRYSKAGDLTDAIGQENCKVTVNENDN